MSITVTADPGRPPDPAYTLELAGALPEIVRALNHATLHHGALGYPAEAYRVICDLAMAAGMLPQLAGQLSRWLSAEQDAGRIKMAGGPYQGDPGQAVSMAEYHLAAVAGVAGQLRQALDNAAQVTAAMGAADSEEGGGDEPGTA